MSNTRPNIERISAQEYEQNLPERLAAGEIDDQSVFTLCVRSLAKSPESFRMPVRVEDVRLRICEAAFKVILLDSDLRPATKRINSMLDVDRNFSTVSLRIIDNGRRIYTPEGYFMPYDASATDAFLRECMQLSESTSAQA